MRKSIKAHEQESQKKTVFSAEKSQFLTEFRRNFAVASQKWRRQNEESWFLEGILKILADSDSESS